MHKSARSWRAVAPLRCLRGRGWYWRGCSCAGGGSEAAKSNYVFKPTAEQDLRSIQSAARRRLNTALGINRKGKTGCQNE